MVIINDGTSNKIQHISTIISANWVLRDCSQVIKSREVSAWVLVALLATLFIGLLTVNIILCIYKQRQTGYNEAQVPTHEVEENPCYETIEVKQITDIETNIYEAVNDV